MSLQAFPPLEQTRVAVVGLGYVGLPLAIEFGRRYDTVGFDINPHRIMRLRAGQDDTLEVSAEELAGSHRLRFSQSPGDLDGCDVFVVTVPTPIDEFRRPDLEPLRRASETVGAHLKPGAVVVFESTVYPGVTEEYCGPILERQSGLKVNRDFYLGYSPERINPGDREHRLTVITKVTSGSTPEAAAYVDALYGSIVTAGTHRAESIRVAEAGKVIENVQRDVNIALINELAQLFGRMGIDTEAVLQAAGTKWNFLPFRPGLVGGHCIGVDPYYLTHKAQQLGHHPEMILAGRRINDGMADYVVQSFTRLLVQRGLSLPRCRVLVLGLTFKENCPDLRNSKVFDVIAGLNSFGLKVDACDPWVNVAQFEGLHAEDLRGARADLVDAPQAGCYDGVLLCVAHRQFLAAGVEAIRGWMHPEGVLYDVKMALPRAAVDGRL